MKLEMWIDLDAVTTPEEGFPYPAGRYCEGICPGHMAACVGYAPFSDSDLWCRHLVDEEGHMPRVGLCRFQLSSGTSGPSEVETGNLG